MNIFVGKLYPDLGTSIAKQAKVTLALLLVSQAKCNHK